MKYLSLIAAICIAFAPYIVCAEAIPGNPAPAFAIKDATGKEQNLNDYKNKWLVLEWFNKDCPYVKKHYGSGNMQRLQKTYTQKGVAWLTVVSSAPGKQGYVDSTEAMRVKKEKGSFADAIILDPDGSMGNAYGAKTTPHMFVIDPKGQVAYAGAIDDNDSSDPSTIQKAKNYVAAALDEGMSGQKIQVTAKSPYGCGVKYKN